MGIGDGSDLEVELAAGLARIKADAATFGPQEQAACFTLLAMVTAANAAANAWAAEYQEICTALMGALQDPNRDMRGAVMKVLRQSSERLAVRLAAEEAGRS